MFASATKGEKYMATLIGVDGWLADFEIKARAAPTFEKYLERFGIHPTNDIKWQQKGASKQVATWHPKDS